MASRIIEGIRFTQDEDKVYRALTTWNGTEIDVWAWKTDDCWHYGTNTYGYDENKGSASTRDDAIRGAIKAGQVEAVRYANHRAALQRQVDDQQEEVLTLKNADELWIASDFRGVTLKMNGADDVWEAHGKRVDINELLALFMMLRTRSQIAGLRTAHGITV